MYKYQNGSAYLRVSEKESLSKSNNQGVDIPKLNLRMISETQGNSWPLGDWGVLGLSPKGSFFTYLSSLYEENKTISIALKYKPKDKKAKHLEFEMQAYLNPTHEQHYKEKDVIGRFLVDSSSESWYLNGSVRLPDSELEYPTQKLCLDTYMDEYFGVIDAPVWCERVRKAVCNTARAKDCTEENAVLELAPKLELMIESHDLSIKPEDYIYFDEYGLQCRIGNPWLTRERESCPKNTKVVLGKMFLSKYMPILEMTRGLEEPSITLVDYFKTSVTRSKAWLGIGILVVVLAVLGLIFVIWRRKQAVHDQKSDEYVQV